MREYKYLGKVGGRPSKLKPLTGRQCHVEIDKLICKVAGIEEVERLYQGDGDIDVSVGHGEVNVRATLGVINDDAENMYRKDISKIKVLYESEDGKKPQIKQVKLDKEKNRKLLNHINAITSGIPVPNTGMNGVSTPNNNIEGKEAGSGYAGKNKSPAVMNAEAYLKSQEVALLAETNQTQALKNQHEDMIMRKQQDERSNNLIYHMLAEAKAGKKRDITDLYIEKKTLLESKRSMLGNRVTDAKLDQLEEDYMSKSLLE